ncbi:hypothetical protein ACFWHX_22630, partial [Streptomyces hirsutus]
MPHATPHTDTTAKLDSALRGGPFHVALRAAIAARGLPLQRVQHHLSRHGVKVGVTSLSYWQQGARRPPRPPAARRGGGAGGREWWWGGGVGRGRRAQP